MTIEEAPECTPTCRESGTARRTVVETLNRQITPECPALESFASQRVHLLSASPSPIGAVIDQQPSVMWRTCLMGLFVAVSQLLGSSDTAGLNPSLEMHN
jgi:hypothetical protein